MTLYLSKDFFVLFFIFFSCVTLAHHFKLLVEENICIIHANRVREEPASMNLHDV